MYYQNNAKLLQDSNINFTEKENLGKKIIDINLEENQDIIIFEVYNSIQDSDINQNSLIELAKNAKTEELPHLIATNMSCHYEELINRENDFINKNKINISNSNSEIFNKDNNKCDNVNNKVNFFLLNYLSNSINLNILINKLYNNCLENINQAISNFAQISFIKDLSSLNNSNINEIRKNINEL